MIMAGISSSDLLRIFFLLLLEGSLSVPLVGELGHYSSASNDTVRSVQNNIQINDAKSALSTTPSGASPTPTVQTTTSFSTTNTIFISTTTEIPVSPRVKEPKHLVTNFFLDGFEDQTEETDYCRLPAKCQNLNYTTCLGSKLPYSKTTIELVNGLRSQEHAQEQLQVWRGLIHLPKCWAVIQPFLCALYMPKCENNLVDLPSHVSFRVR